MPQSFPQQASIDEIVEMLEHSRDVFRAAAKETAAEKCGLKPAEDRWSVIEIVEHVAKVEVTFLGWLTTAEVSESPNVDREKEAQLMEAVAGRKDRAVAPERVQPNGQFQDLGEALGGFDAARDRTIQFVREQGPRLYQLQTKHPRRGPVNGVELLTIAAGHARRHAEQVRETVAALA